MVVPAPPAIPMVAADNIPVIMAVFLFVHGAFLLFLIDFRRKLKYNISVTEHFVL